MGAGLAAMSLSACGVFGSSGSSPSPTVTTPTMPAAACAEGDSVTPPDIADFTLNGVPAAQFITPLVVPYNGLSGGSDGQPSILRLEVVTSASGAPVRFRASGAQLLSSLTDDTLGEPEVTVFSEAGAERCVASAYLFSTAVGPAKVVVEGLNSAEATFNVITTREASRNVSLSLSAGTVNAGSSIDAVVSVTDVFGNPIENASVDLSLPAKGPGVFVTGANTFTVLTDPKGRASVEIQTRANKGGTLKVTAKGDLAACQPLANQYTCDADQPVPGFAAASGPQSRSITITAPSVTITKPSPGTAYSTGELFDVQGTTKGVKEGTTVRLVAGDGPAGASTVKANGTFTFRDVLAQTGGSGDLGYVVYVGELKPVPLDIRVKTFSIVSYKRVEAGLKFRVAAGAWPNGTIIELTRDGKGVSKLEVTESGKDVYLLAPDTPGFYQVQVDTNRGIVYGVKVQPVL